MRSKNSLRPHGCRSQSALRIGLAVTAAGFMMLAGMAANAGPDYSGEQFLFHWTETSGSDIGLTGSADLTLGPASATKPGYFDVASFAIIYNGGICGICSPVSENLSGELFDSTTSGLAGTVTGSFLTKNGSTATFTLDTMDLPTGTWTFDAVNAAGATATADGTYTTTTVSSVDEPATLLLFITAALGLLVCLGRRRTDLSG
jgi:hypothetical protein